MSDAITPDEQLLLDVKSYLHITWQDDNTDKNIREYINNGESRLQDVAGVSSLDFAIKGLPRSLLFDYCRYANSQALEMFEKNFASELLDLNLSNQFAAPGKMTVISNQGSTAGYTKILASPQLDTNNSYLYKLGTEISIPGYFDVCDIVNGYIVWNGVDEILASNGTDIVVVEVNENNKAIRAGKTTVVAG